MIRLCEVSSTIYEHAVNAYDMTDEHENALVELCHELMPVLLPYCDGCPSDGDCQTQGVGIDHSSVVA